MHPNKTVTTTTVKGPISRKARIFSILGTALLMTCLLAGFAQAADTGNVLNDNGNHLATIASLSGQDLSGQGQEPSIYCGSSKVKCFANVKVNGYWYIQMVGYAEHGCTADTLINCYPDQDTVRSCEMAYPRYEIIDAEIVEKCG